MIRLEQEGVVGRLLIDRSAKRNAFTLAMWEELPRLLDRAARLPGLRVLTVQAAEPGAFCAGADLGELLAHRDDAPWRRRNQLAMNAAQHALVRFPLPTVAVIGGDAVGAGCGLAVACDIRVASANARIGLTPAKLGLAYPLHDVKLLVDLIGPGQARRMLFTGSLLNASEARRIGLFELEEADLESLIAAIAATSPHSTQTLKGFVRRILDGQSDDDEETLEQFAEAFEGADFHEGIAAFTEKRTPDFSGNDDTGR